MIVRLLVSVCLIGANAFFTAAEFALIATRRSWAEQLAREGNRSARALSKSLHEVSTMLAGAQFGITVTSLVLGFVAEPLVAQLFERLFSVVNLPPEIGHALSFAFSLAIVVFFHMVFGEMVPKNIVIAEPERAALLIAIPFRAFVNVFRVLIQVLNSMGNAILRILGVSPDDVDSQVHTAREIGAMLAESKAQGLIPELEHQLLRGTLGIRKLNAAEVMIPRTSMVTAEVTDTPATIEAIVRRTGHSRIPIFENEIDNILGFVHAKDLLVVPNDERSEPIRRSIVRDIMIVPETRKLQPLLFDMRAQQRQFALVIDEHGGTAGLVTLEDLLEEVVGDIRDEYDRGTGDIRAEGPNRWICQARLRPDEISEITGLTLPEGDYDTIGGYMLERLGHIPKSGETVTHQGWTLQVRTMAGLRVGELIILAPS